MKYNKLTHEQIEMLREFKTNGKISSYTIFQTYSPAKIKRTFEVLVRKKFLTHDDDPMFAHNKNGLTHYHYFLTAKGYNALIMLDDKHYSRIKHFLADKSANIIVSATTALITEGIIHIVLPLILPLFQ